MPFMTSLFRNMANSLPQRKLNTPLITWTEPDKEKLEKSAACLPAGGVFYQSGRQITRPTMPGKCVMLGKKYRKKQTVLLLYKKCTANKPQRYREKRRNLPVGKKGFCLAALHGIIAAKRLLYFYFYAGFAAPLGQPKTMAVYTVPALPSWYNSRKAAIILLFLCRFSRPFGATENHGSLYRAGAAVMV
ncbi:MAG: hypothetical protein MSH10_09045 [Pygmaiobacter massiliensis]|nr:hypothetical protein [Pygmaiobacter massiliensis]